MPLATPAFNTQGNEMSQKKSISERKVGKKGKIPYLMVVLSSAWKIYKKTVAKLLPKMGSFCTNLVQQNYF